MTSAILFLPVLALGYLAASFVQMTLHRLLGHGALGGPIHRVHVGSHHRIFSGDRIVAHAYAKDEASLTPLFAGPAAAVLAIFYWVLPAALFLAASLGFLGTYALQAWLHEQFHLHASPLRRHGWFRRLRRLHAVHHHDPRKTLGLTDFVWDRLFGTFADPEHRRS